MTRTILERLVLFALPFIAYGVWVALDRLRLPPVDRRHPWMLLTIAGLLLVAASFILWRESSVEPTTGLYVAPHLVNGKIVPGYVAPAPEPKKK